jgi:hypothetical protein
VLFKIADSKALDLKIVSHTHRKQALAMMILDFEKAKECCSNTHIQFKVDTNTNSNFLIFLSSTQKQKKWKILPLSTKVGHNSLFPYGYYSITFGTSSISLKKSPQYPCQHKLQAI